MRNQTVVDLRIDADWVIPVEPAGKVFAQHSVIVGEGRIQDILPSHEADVRYLFRERLRLPGHVLMPGLVNLHTHAAMTLLRGFADDLPLMTWLNDHIWPAEGRWMSHGFVMDGSRLACVEMLKGGVTCFNDMYFFPDATIEAALEAKMRVAAGIIVIDFPSAWAADPDGYLLKGMEVRDAYRHQPLVSFCLAPHAPYSCADKTLEKVQTYAAQLDLPIHMHVHETHDEIHKSLETHKVRPLERLHGLGLLGPQFVAVHAVHLTNEEIVLLAEQGCHVAHCPTSNLKLANGVAPKARLLDAGVNVGVGTDGAASNNRLDVFEETRLAALLAKGVSGRADAVPAPAALAMATLNGARALGLDSEIGSLVPGKQADIVAVDLSGAAMQPCYDPISQLVYCAGREQVRHVWVAGEMVVKDGRCLSLDEAHLVRHAHQWRERIAAG
ncbi:TRZ/ATZ family hydrolase [Parasulfuritortus cantonensis]|uniref:5-methylthioadenosine/S-adenosylhomocysteine deaminase n=1 Tax=Parasulfuritortus cantonensis TaxID=2528202 RepID=A0A4V2NWE1_9PROT|nr:TRZ/ATZ family hydrolase [Parasulfuritortus cantonensis]TCJ17002.1 TRZ/ATZ family hydrolase [Parasulfuritortus cantonensis]